MAREVANRLGGDGRVVGVDVNEAMLTVARRLGPDIEWRAGDAANLPFADGSFDVVVCQAALMFFRDRAAALREMARVATAGGTVVFHVWASLKDQLAYRRLVDVAARHAGPDAVSLLSSYWVLGDLDELRLLCKEAGLEITEARTRVGTARFASIDELVRIEVESTPLIERIDDGVFRKILDDAGVALSEFRTDQGNAEVPIVGHIVTTRASSGTAPTVVHPASAMMLPTCVKSRLRRPSSAGACVLAEPPARDRGRARQIRRSAPPLDCAQANRTRSHIAQDADEPRPTDRRFANVPGPAIEGISWAERASA